MDLYQVGIFVLSFYSNIEFAAVMVLLQRGQNGAAYSVDVIHRVLTPIFLVLGSAGVFVLDDSVQHSLFVAMFVLSGLGLVAVLTYMRWRYILKIKRGSLVEDGGEPGGKAVIKAFDIADSRQVQGEEC